MKVPLSLLFLTPIFLGFLSASETATPASQVQIALLPPSQASPELPPSQLTLLFRSDRALYYRLDTADKTLSVGRLIKGEHPVSLPWSEIEQVGRVPLTLSVIDRDRISRREFCLIFSTAPRPVDLDGRPVPADDFPLMTGKPKPHISIESASKSFDDLLQDIRATPAPARPYELVDPNVYNRMSVSPVNLLLFAAVQLAKKLFQRKRTINDEISCRYTRQGETGREWVTMRVMLIRRPLPQGGVPCP